MTRPGPPGPTGGESSLPPAGSAQGPSPAGLVGRDAELGRVEALLDEARRGRSGALVVTGPRGSGKSALVGAAQESAAGFAILRSQGAEDESEVAFSGLYELLAPILELRAELPDPQRTALEGALALGPPTGSDRFAVSVATLGMLTAAAESEPLLVVVEDLEWIDESSLAPILFALRRIGADRIAAVLTRREGGLGASELRGMDELALSPLSPEDARRLLSERAERSLASGVSDAILAEAGGNPLVIVQAARLLSQAQLGGEEPLHGPLPISDAMAQRLEREAVRAGEDGQRALTLLAAAGAATRLDVLAPALAQLGLGLSTLEEVEAVDLVRIRQDRVEFADPLMRSVAYQRASARGRRAAHRALADALDGTPRAEQRAWHLAQSAIGPDEDAARALEEAAASAAARGGHGAAARALERSATLTADAAPRARRLVAAARDAHVAGRSERAIELIEEALALDDGDVRADAVHLRGRIQAWRAPVGEVHDALVAEAERVARDDPVRAAVMLAHAALPVIRAGDVESGLATARRAAELGAGGDAPSAEWTLALGLIVSGRAREAAPIVERWAARLATQEPTLAALEPWQAVQRALIWLERYDEARALLDSFVAWARRSAPGALPFGLGTLAELDFRTGRLAAALAGASEGATLAHDMGQAIGEAFCLACLARVTAVTGRDEECRAAADGAMRIGMRLGEGTPITTLGAPGLGLLDLGRGDPASAVEHLAPVAAASDARGMREPAMVQYRPNLVEALIRLDRVEDAERALGELERQAEATGRTWAHAAAARCRGLLAPDAEVDGWFQRALEWHDRTPTPFERARTELCFGERLRRGRRRADARERLRAALAGFERMGAEPWSEAARRELGVSGETARRRSEPRSDELTPQELQVALLVSTGATNKEAGAALFLSAKTIEAHLGRVYRKLGIRSRTELAALASRGDLADAPEG